MLFFKTRKESRRIEVEDALKHIYNHQYANECTSRDCLAEALELSPKETGRLLNELQEKELLEISGENFKLTPAGEEWALQVIRAHRLWERFLADETDIPLHKVHKHAEKREHKLSVAEVDQLDAQLGYPQHDPHGDPIPSAHHEIEPAATIPLIHWEEKKTALVSHVEDEPPEKFSQIIALGLLPGTPLKVLESGPEGLLLQSAGRKFRLPMELVGNISVKPAPETLQEIEAEPLSILNTGEKGKILYLKSQGLTRRRFMDLGMVPGTVIEVLMPSLFGEPKAYRIRGTTIALRKEQANQIFIQKMKD